MTTGPDHWRYREYLEADGVRVVAEKYTVIRETPKCWVVVDRWAAKLIVDGVFRNHADYIRRESRYVLKDQSHGRRFCYADKGQALRSYLKRKEAHARRAKLSLSMAELAFAGASKALADGAGIDSIECGHDAHTSSFDFSGC